MTTTGVQTKLDRKHSYGTVYGHPQIGYVQGDQEFKHDGTLHIPEPEKPKVAATLPTADAFPTAAQIASAPEVLRAIEGISSQLKDLKEPKGPDPARSEAARRIWAERRAREAEVGNAESSIETV